jgi:hypothetical protein
MLGDLAQVAEINYENITRDEAFSQALWLISGLAGFGVFTATLDLFGSYSLGTVFTSFAGGTFVYAHVLGAIALAFALARGGLGIDAMKELPTGELAIVIAGVGVFFITAWSTGLESWIVSNDLLIVGAVAVQNAAFVIINKVA